MKYKIGDKVRMIKPHDGVIEKFEIIDTGSRFYIVRDDTGKVEHRTIMFFDGITEKTPKKKKLYKWAYRATAGLGWMETFGFHGTKQEVKDYHNVDDECMRLDYTMIEVEG